MRWSWLTMVALACGTPSDPTDTALDDTDEPLGPAGQLHGTVTDATGAPVEGAQVNLCLSICSTVASDVEGAFRFDPLVVGDYSFHIVPPEGSGLAEPLVPWAIEDGTDPSVTVVLPELGEPVALSEAAAELEVAPGLFLTVAQGDLEVLFSDPPTEIAGARAESDAWLPLDLPGDPLAVWYLAPYEASAESVGGLPLRLANDLDLDEGATVELWRASYWDYAFVKVGDLEVEGEWLVADDARLPELTTLVLVEPAE